jgi:electron transfer flavoprotein alpha subunit
VILVIAEQKDGRLNRASWEAIAAAQQVPGGGPVTVAVLGSGVSAVAAELAQADVDGVLVVDAPALADYTPDAFVQALQQVVAEASPSHLFLPHTYQTRDFAPTLAARLDRALVTDVIALKSVDGQLAFARPMFQGKLIADVAPQGPAPHIITFQIGAVRADSVRKANSPARVSAAAVTIDASAIRQKPGAPFQDARQAVDLSQAERIVAIGRGIKSQENIAVAERLAKACGAELAASRPICDNGWLPMERQIGSSGQTVAPKLYVVGMKGARTIVAINKDAEAPIFEIADYGIVGDLFEIAPAVVAELEKN